MAAKRTTARRTAKTPSPAVEPEKCTACEGSGNVAVTVRVGRGRRSVGQQDGFCLACYGTGTAANS